MGPDTMIFVFWMSSFKPTFSLSSFTFIKRLSSSSSFSAIKVVSPAYLRLLIFLLAILIPACVSSSLAFHMIYSVYKLNKQGDNIQPWRIPFPILNQLIVPCLVLTVASWPIYRFLQKQGKWCCSHLFKNFPQFFVIHTVKGFGLVNEAEEDVFFWNCLAFSMIQWILAIWSLGSSVFLKCNLNIWKYSVHILLKPDLENFEHYFASMWDECKCAVIWTFFDIVFLWDWNENDLFQSCSHWWVFQICLHLSAAV